MNYQCIVLRIAKPKTAVTLNGGKATVRDHTQVEVSLAVDGKPRTA